ncbi:AlbA family DNA-binding domain-containing protein [Lacipirellula sp.]|uniref:AlbA family DNA-binding domain-containing protein n=1 Tax=Lacipirellula sp. TaxID=2691419 RepID=UPI003D1441C4
MSLQAQIADLVARPESDSLEFKAVLPPSRSMAQVLCAFANSHGGHLVLGVDEGSGTKLISGLSKDFHADTIIQRAIGLLSPRPEITYEYSELNDKALLVLSVAKSKIPITTNGKQYRREGNRTIEVGRTAVAFRENNYPSLQTLSARIDQFNQRATSAKGKFNSHIQSVLKIADDLAILLYPDSPTTATSNREGKILMRILFSSCADIFEGYLSDLLYEIYLANPATLRSNEQVTVAEILSCSDIQEFIDIWARKKISKLQRGSVKGFIAENKHIKCLDELDDQQQLEIERILQIRHLYSHRNGTVDEKFLKYFPSQYSLNDEHVMSAAMMIGMLTNLVETVHRIDESAIGTYHLAASC